MKNTDFLNECLDEVRVPGDYLEYHMVQNQRVSTCFRIQNGRISMGLHRKLHYGRSSRGPFVRPAGASEAKKHDFLKICEMVGVDEERYPDMHLVRNRCVWMRFHLEYVPLKPFPPFRCPRRLEAAPQVPSPKGGEGAPSLSSFREKVPKTDQISRKVGAASGKNPQKFPLALSERAHNSGQGMCVRTIQKNCKKL